VKNESLVKIGCEIKFIKSKFIIIFNHNLLPLLPPSLLVVSVGMGVTSSILPILNPDLARALMAAWAPGPGDLVSVPPLALSLI
jgi:hypothetical protein